LALPFFERPTKLDGSHAGDYGFDPLGFTEEWDLYFLQESELRHARLAMLAAVGWPLSELVAPSWMLQEGGRVPSVLNGVNPLTFFAIASTLGALGYFEYKTALRRNLGTRMGDLHRKDMDLIWKYGVAGDYNFDPLNFYNVLGDDAIGRKALREMEISHGRYAMVGITYFAAWEALTKHAVVENNPLFHPNNLVPFAAISYLIWSQFYRISDVRKYPIKIEYTKDGEEMLRGIERSIKSIDTEGILNAMNLLSDATGNAVEQIQKSKSMKSILDKIKDMQEGV
jgi:Chlorophyll A-B binding protein